MATRRDTGNDGEVLEATRLPIFLPEVLRKLEAPPVPPAPPEPPPPPPPAPQSVFAGPFRGVFQQAKEAVQTVEEAKALLLAVAPLPASFTLAAMLQWARDLKAVAGVRADVAKAIATIEAAYPPKDGGGGLLEAFGKVVETAAAAGGAVIDVAANSVFVQGAAAIATGGLSLAAQAALEAATGRQGPILSTVEKVVEDPLAVVKELPGIVLTEGGLIGTVADVLSAGGAVINVLAPNTAVGEAAGAVHEGVEAVQQGAKDNPAASLAVIGGIAATAVGLPGGREALLNNIGEILGFHSQPPPEDKPPAPGNTGFIPPEALAQAAAGPGTQATTLEAKPRMAALLERFTKKELAAGAAAVVGLFGLGAWAVWGRA